MKNLSTDFLRPALQAGAIPHELAVSGLGCQVSACGLRRRLQGLEFRV